VKHLALFFFRPLTGDMKHAKKKEILNCIAKKKRKTFFLHILSSQSFSFINFQSFFFFFAFLSQKLRVKIGKILSRAPFLPEKIKLTEVIG
jgi:hypothetical protein